MATQGSLGYHIKEEEYMANEQIRHCFLCRNFSADFKGHIRGSKSEKLLLHLL